MAFHDEVNWLIEKLRDADFVLDMDITAFDAMYHSFRKNEAKQLLQDTRLAALAQHDPGELMEDWKIWFAVASGKRADEIDDQAELVADFGPAGF